LPVVKCSGAAYPDVRIVGLGTCLLVVMAGVVWTIL
jgi:hypothetical protein